MNSMMRMWDYHQWANRRFLRHGRTLPESSFTAPVASVFSSVADMFAHLAAADRLWFERLRGNMDARLEPVELGGWEQAEALYDGLMSEITAFLAEDRADRVAVYRNSKGEVFRDTVGDIVTHTVNHGTYHRGNAAAMLRQMGFAGVSTDYIFYVREVRGND